MIDERKDYRINGDTFYVKEAITVAMARAINVTLSDRHLHLGVI